MNNRYVFEEVSVLLYTEDDEYFYEGHKVICRDKNLKAVYVYKMQFETKAEAIKCRDYYIKNGLENRLHLDWKEVNEI